MKGISPPRQDRPTEAGDAIPLETAFVGGGHLNASGEISSIEAFSGAGFEGISTLVFISNKENGMDESGQWKVGRTD